MSEPLRVVSIGGGHGLSALLEGLKKYTRADAHQVDITAIVTVTDDGGSSGRLRREFDVLPPGDIRNCMVALCEDGALLSRLFQYRFKAGHGLKGHSFGNLFLTALTEITGDFPDAVRSSAEVLKIAGRIFPSTAANVALEAVLEDGKVVRGESRISRSRRRIREIRLSPARVRPLAETLDAIASADLITLGPGSLFTSVVPNLLVSGIPAAIRRSQARKAYFLNLMSQPGETTNFTASDHVAVLHQHAKGKLVDSIVVSTSRIPPRMMKKYAEQNAVPIPIDMQKLAEMGLEIVAGDLAQMDDKIRHNSDAIGRVAREMALRAAYETRAAESPALH